MATPRLGADLARLAGATDELRAFLLRQVPDWNAAIERRLHAPSAGSVAAHGFAQAADAEAWEQVVEKLWDASDMYAARARQAEAALAPFHAFRVPRPLTFDAYAREAYKTAGDACYDLENVAYGLTRASAKLAAALQEKKFRSGRFDAARASDALGDATWYAAVGAAGMATSFAGVARGNLARLSRKYPNAGVDPRALEHAE